MNKEELKQKALELHKKSKGKIEITPKVEVKNKDDLSLVYSPGVAEPCLEIAKDKNNSFIYTSRANTMAIVSDGSAVLGLGNIGAEAAMPVMEGKSILFKNFGGINCVPLCVNTQDPEEIIKFCKQIEPSFGAINLEDITAPNCVVIERRLIKEMNIPVFHDDQHGTAIVVAAGILNACKLAGKKIADLKIFISGTGAAGSSIIKTLHNLGARKITAYNRKGVVHKDNVHYTDYHFLTLELIDNYLDQSIPFKPDLSSAIEGYDVFIGISAAGLVTKDMVKSMNKDPFIFALANPVPEIMPEDALEAGAFVVATGRSDYPNQINNVLAFPGIFKGAMESFATKITDKMKLAAIEAIASIIPDNELKPDYIIPSPFDKKVPDLVAKKVHEMAIKEGVIRKL